MLPLVNKPLIQYAVEEAVASGIEQIIVVTAMGKHTIEDHFDRSFELERVLEQKGETELLEETRKLSNLVDICYIRQKGQRGLGHAISVARELVGGETFAVLLPDDIIAHDVPALKQMMEVYDRYQTSIVAIEKVKKEDINKYGIIKAKNSSERIYRVLDLVEKPEPEEAPSNLGVVGRYILTPRVFEALEVTSPGKGGEIQITDALRLLLKHEAIYAYQFRGARYDTGTPLGLLKAAVALALRDPSMGTEFGQYLRQLMRSQISSGAS
jgi:UTP--glucose-1-phosphate uridylyltransferase